MNTRRWKTCTVLLSIVFIAMLFWTWIKPLQIRRISNARLADAIAVIEADNHNTAFWYGVIGTSGESLYVEYEIMIHPLGFLTNEPKTTVMVIDKKDLTEGNKDRLRALGYSIDTHRPTLPAR